MAFKVKPEYIEGTVYLMKRTDNIDVVILKNATQKELAILAKIGHEAVQEVKDGPGKS